MLSLQELSHRVVLTNNIIKTIDTQRKPFLIRDETEVIQIAIYVLENITKTSYLKFSDHEIYVLIGYKRDEGR